MTDTQTSAPGAPVAEKPRGNSVINLLKFAPDPLKFMTDLAQTSELGIVAVRTGNQTLRLVTDPALIKRAIELDDPPTLGRGRFPRVSDWYGGEGIFVKTSGPEHARQRDTLGRPIWNDPQTPPIARRRAGEMSAAWREGGRRRWRGGHAGVCAARSPAAALAANGGGFHGGAAQGAPPERF